MEKVPKHNAFHHLSLKARELLALCIDANCLFLVDIDECNATNALCHNNAICTNTIGSYVCSCIQGFSGDGKLNCASVY